MVVNYYSIIYYIIIFVYHLLKFLVAKVFVPLIWDI